MRGSDDCLEWVSKVARTAKDEEFAEWSVLLWYLWKERNAHLFNRAKLPEEEIAMRAQAFLNDYRQYQEVLQEGNAPAMIQGWKRPNPGMIKVNVDLGVVDGGMGLVVVIRNAGGSFVLAAAKMIRDRRDPKMGEALAGEFGLMLVRQHQLGIPILETDCLNFVSRLSMADHVHTELGVVCWNIRRL
ncbi:unnamed protein product [Linum trigynum]|uniref:RNase H type-1 domain-containing protein n=1 Tax=Linum trigynum TaxID=586398 RepID=A0AAV2DAL6_9ROSI